MHDFKYDRINTVEAQTAARKVLADLMEAFEATHGPVETLPIRLGDKPVPYRISCPERKKAAKEKAVKTRKARLGTPQARKNAVLREVWA